MTQKEMVRNVFANGVDIKAPVKDVLAAIKSRYKQKISGNVVSTVRQELLRAEVIPHENPDALLTKVENDQVSRKSLMMVKQTALACGGIPRMLELVDLLKDLTKV